MLRSAATYPEVMARESRLRSADAIKVISSLNGETIRTTSHGSSATFSPTRPISLSGNWEPMTLPGVAGRTMG